jgi:hypothetical protein
LQNVKAPLFDGPFDVLRRSFDLLDAPSGLEEFLDLFLREQIGCKVGRPWCTWIYGRLPACQQPVGGILAQASINISSSRPVIGWT